MDKVYYLKKARKYYSRQFGQQGDYMSQNAFELYLCYKQLGDSRNMINFIKKATWYSSRSQRVNYLIQLANEYAALFQQEQTIMAI